MRPIDADALKNYLAEKYVIYDNIFDGIDAQPTIEPDTAEFIRADCKSYYKVICSKCGHEPIENDENAFYFLTPYCPFCGRKIIKINLKEG